MTNSKYHVIYIEHINYGTEIVGVCVEPPNRKAIESAARDYVRRYTFDQDPNALDLEYKQITKMDYVIVPGVC